MFFPSSLQRCLSDGQAKSRDHYPSCHVVFTCLSILFLLSLVNPSLSRYSHPLPSPLLLILLPPLLPIPHSFSSSSLSSSFIISSSRPSSYHHQQDPKRLKMSRPLLSSDPDGSDIPKDHETFVYLRVPLPKTGMG